MPRVGAALVIALGLTWASVAWSSNQAANEAEAAQLFDRGLSAMHAKRFDEACADLARSYALAPLMGVLLTLAECEAGRGRHALALRHYRAYLDRFVRLPPQDRQRQRRRMEAATDQVAALERLVEVAPPAPPRGNRQTIVSKLPKKSAEPTLPKKSAQPAPSHPAPPSTWSTQRTLALVTAGVGVLGIVAGSITGGLALGKKSAIDAHCDGLDCDREGKSAADRAQALAMGSNIAFAVGVAGLAGGTALWLTMGVGETSSAFHRTNRPGARHTTDARHLLVGLGGTW